MKKKAPKDPHAEEVKALKDKIYQLSVELKQANATVDSLEWGFRLAKKYNDQLEVIQTTHLNQLAEMQSIIHHLKEKK